MPVLMATITTMVVFFPLTFMTGVGKHLFTPLAFSACRPLRRRTWCCARRPAATRLRRSNQFPVEHIALGPRLRRLRIVRKPLPCGQVDQCTQWEVRHE